MIRNYIITAWRNILKDKFYTFLNITGLAIGLIASIYIFLYIIDELTYDRSHVNYKRIYRLESHFVISGKEDNFAVTQIPLAPTLKDDYPEIEEYVRLAPIGTLFFKVGEHEFQEDSLMFCDSTIFHVFTHPFIAGDPENALNKPYTIVLTETLSKKLFGSENPIGQVLKTIDGDIYEVTGVIKDLPENIHMRFSGLLSGATYREMVGSERFNDRSANAFWNVGIYSYILLKEGVDIQSVLDKSPQFYDKYMKSLGDQINASFTLKAKALAKVHHYSSDLGYDQPGGNIKYVFVFALVAILILLIACINYMNLATARSAKRSKETGMRKIAGAQRKLLIRQFLVESLIIALFSTIFAIIIGRILLPYFNIIANKSLSFSVLLTPAIIFGILILTFLVGMISGSYPAFYLSSFDPVNTIKGKTDSNGGNGLLRKILVVFQFTISVVMITGTFIINSQLNFMQNSNPGFNKENLMIMEMRDTTFKKSLESFKQELLKNPEITEVAYSTGDPGYTLGIQVMRIEGDSGTMVERAVNNYFIDYDYLDVLGIKLVAGRNYDRSIPTDQTQSFIINETAARKFGWVDSTGLNSNDLSAALGKKFQYGYRGDGTFARDGEIIGIVKDFNYASMKNPIEPIVLLLNTDDRNMFYANIRISNSNNQQTIDLINSARKQFNDAYPFKYKFLDENLREFYRGEQRISMLVRTFAILTVIIAALGLLGLSSFLTQTRTREIGIRKIAGASPNTIVMMFAKEFSLWIVLANIIAAPFVLLILNKWLQSFPYKTDIQVWIFIAGLVISVLVALLTVSLRVIQAANINPSEAVRYT